MSLRGVTRPLCMDVTLNAVKRHPLPPFRRTAGFSATASLSRAEFGMTAWKNVIGDQVELRIEAEALRDRGAGEPAEGADDATPPADAVPPDQASEPANESATPESQEPNTPAAESTTP